MDIVKTLPVALALTVIAPLPLMAQQSPSSQSAAAQRSPAAQYVARAAIGDMFEIQSSKLALERSQDNEVRDFADRMVADHGNLSAKLKSAAKAAGVDVPNEMDQKHKEKLKKLSDAESSEAFDRLYISEQTSAHQTALKLHSDYARNGSQPELKKVASGAEPVIQAHADKLKAIKK